MGYDAPNYTQTPNAFLDEHLSEMGCAETKVVLAVIRQTFGWHQEKDQLSISQLMEMTGLSNRAVIDATRQAMERGVIDREPDGDSYRYWLVVGGENSSQVGEKGVNEAHTPCEDTSQQGVNEAHTQKKRKKPEKDTRARKGEGGMEDSPFEQDPGEQDPDDETPPEHGPPVREDDPSGVKIWVDVTGKRPTIQTRQTLKNAFTGEDGPRWSAPVFRKVLRRAYLNVDLDPGRINVGYLLDDYKEKLRRGDGVPRADQVYVKPSSAQETRTDGTRVHTRPDDYRRVCR